MRVAVCVSGLPRGRVKENVERLKRVFPFSFHFTTWKDQKDALLDIYRDEPIAFKTYPEPGMHYHPGFEFVGECPQNYRRWLNSSQARSERWKHRTKQILGHAMQLQDLPEEYDMIIRARYDTEICEDALTQKQIQDFIEESYYGDKAIGFFTPKGQNDRMKFVERLPKTHQRRYQHLPDHLIMHPRGLFDIDRAWDLHVEKKLIVAEVGWWQVLSQPYGSNHESIYGFAGVDLTGQPK